MEYTIVTADEDEKYLGKLNDTISSSGDEFEISAMFTDGKNLLHYLQRNSVNLVICSCTISSVSGWKIADYIAEFKSETDIILTGKDRKFDELKKVLYTGAINYFLKPYDADDITSTLKKIKKRTIHRNSAALKSIAGHIEEFLTDKFNIEDFVNIEINSKNVIEKANKYISEHYNTNITRKDVADAVYMNPSYFSRYYKKMTGKFYSDYLAEVRVERAISLMKSGKNSSEIPAKVGYHARRYFNNNFYNIMGMTPKEYQSKLNSNRQQ